MILIISASLRKDSNSRILAHEAKRLLEQDGNEVTLVDLRDHPLPLCDGGAAYGHPSVAAIGGLLAKASAVLVATPIYNYGTNAAVKNLIELTGDGWENKAVGFLCAAGGMSSFMSVMSLANCLMLDFRSVIVPRFVYATAKDFADGRIGSAELSGRVAELARETARFGRLLKAA
ncbi:MAG TPA: NADPH-dependent FMN reductase [Opitutaceae bacterium]